MELKELSQVYWLTMEIAKDEKRLEELQLQAAGVSSPKYDGMPHGSDVGSATEKLVAEIVDRQAIIMAKRLQCEHEKNRLERSFVEIEDSCTRQIFEHRFVECLTWDEVAQAMHMTSDGVKKRCYRYLDSTK